MAVLEIKGVSKSFGSTRVLDAIELDVGDGEIVSLLGPSGCGKSTLLRIVAGLEREDAGEVHLAGCDVRGEPPGRRNIAMVFQNLALYPHLTARENIALPLRVRRLTRLQRLLSPLRMSRRIAAVERGIEASVTEFAARLRILDLLDRRPAALSGGQRQRVALGRALIRKSRLLLMDEPLSSLDAKLRVQARDEIVQIQRGFGVSCVFVTHDQAEAMAISDRVAVMLAGRIAQCGTPAEIYHDPVSIEVAQFIGTPSINILAGEVDARGVLTVGSRPLPLTVPDLVGRRVWVGIRPEHVRLVPAHPGGALAVSVTRIEDLGSDVFVHLGAPEPGGAALVARAVQPCRVRRGERVGVSLEAAALLVFDEEGRRRHPTAIHPAMALHG